VRDVAQQQRPVEDGADGDGRPRQRDPAQRDLEARTGINIETDIDRIVEIWTDCLATYGGPFLFGKQRSMADAMYAPVVTRFLTYDVKLNKPCIQYCQTIMAMPEMKEWVAAAKKEPDDIEELDMDF